MSKKIDLNWSVYDITKTYPEVIDIMANLGFDEIKKPAMLNSVGRIMTIPKGAKAKGISIPVVIAELIKNGFEITGNMPDISSMGSKQFQAKETGNTVLLKDYLKRLGNGEDLESVKKDFVQNFSDVDASEIMKAEQELIKEGTPITEVQKLCDVHSALFHGLTKEEKIANAEKAVEESLKKEETSEMTTTTDAYVRMVRSIIESFKNHTRDSVPVRMEKQGKPFLVTYYAVRDKKDNYLGTVEVVQDMQFAKEHFTS